MTYPHLPAVGSSAVPTLHNRPSGNRSTRGGRRPRLVFVHRWSGGTFESVQRWLNDPESQASAHLIYGGEIGHDAGRAVQLVPFAEKAWTQCDLNPVGISIESADAIWLGHDPQGFARLARIVALLCHHHLNACRPVTGHGIVAGSHGFCRHADGGHLGCGHLSCPTADHELWRQFSARVVAEHRHGGFRERWGK